MLTPLPTVVLVLQLVLASSSTSRIRIHIGFDGYHHLQHRGHLCWWCCLRLLSCSDRHHDWCRYPRKWCGASGLISATGGYVVFSGYSDNSLTARVSAIDASFTTTGDAGVFTTDNTTRYLFVQGGTTDLVVRLSDEASLSAGKAGIFKSGTTIGLGDSDA